MAEAEANHLYDILRYAKENNETKFSVRLRNWNMGGVYSPNIVPFTAYGLGLREAIRGERSTITVVLDDSMVDAWRTEEDVSMLNVENVRFFPAENFFKESAVYAIASVALTRPWTFSPALTPDTPEGAEKMEQLVNDMRGWYESGI